VKQSFAIATKPSVIANEFGLAEHYDFQPIVRPFEGDMVPVIIQEPTGLEMHMASWGIANQYNETTPWIPTKRLMASRPFNLLIHSSRCVIPVNCFISNTSSNPLLIRLLNHRCFGLGGVVQRDKGQLKVSIITTRSADILASHMDEMPVVITSGKASSWLAKKELYRIMEMMDKSGNHWFDYFKIADVFSMDHCRSADLAPVGASHVQRQHELEKLKKLEIDKMRVNRTSSKG
jgi:putative SOS response-associated peptidase YedK